MWIPRTRRDRGEAAEAIDFPQLEIPDGPLVTGNWLQDHLEHPRVRVLDVRGRHPSSALPHAKRAEYLAGHIPGGRVHVNGVYDGSFNEWSTDPSRPVEYGQAA